VVKEQDQKYAMEPAEVPTVSAASNVDATGSKPSDKTNDEQPVLNQNAASTLPEQPLEPEPETAHVLFMDIVGFSLLPTHRQNEAIRKLNAIVSSTDEFRRAEAKDQLICLPTGDGMALVFFTRTPLAAVKCAQQICGALQKSGPPLNLRIGIHSGPVYRLENINNEPDVSGSGINIAQRVMDRGDAGHILLSNSVADYLIAFDKDNWAGQLHDLGKVKVKHGVYVHLFNLSNGTLGQQKLPAKVQAERRRKKLLIAGLALAACLIIACAATIFLFRGAKRIESIAALPFTNVSTDPATDYLPDGITELIIGKLSQLPDMKVTPVSSVFRYKKSNMDAIAIGRELGVQAVLTGRITQRGDTLSITAELINVGDNSQIWSEQYTEKLNDNLPGRISLAISENLRLKLTGEDRRRLLKSYTENTEVYQAYLQGRFFWNKRSQEDLKRAIEYFNQVIAKEPAYAPAYVGLADCYVLLAGNTVSSKEAMPKVKAAARKALELDQDNTLAEAHASLAFAKMKYDWDRPGAEVEFKRAIELKPIYPTAHQWYSFSLRAMGRFDEALEEIKVAQAQDQRSLIIATSMGGTYYFARQYDEAISQLQQIIEKDPNFTTAHLYLGRAFEQKKMYDQAIAEFQKAHMSPDDLEALAALGHAYAVSGKKAEANKILDELLKLSRERYVSPYFIATVYTGLGDKTRAFEWLDKTFEDRNEGMIWLQTEPMLDPLRSDRRFADLQRRVEQAAIRN
jgi:TolB-like protein/class 3 adenylate cyclase/Tfp pilus assembly protein PilF